MSNLRIAALTACALISAPAWAQPQREKPRNVIFVLVDDLRFDAMGFLTPGLKTPNIDRLAREGIYFPNAVVTPHPTERRVKATRRRYAVTGSLPGHDCTHWPGREKSTRTGGHPDLPLAVRAGL